MLLKYPWVIQPVQQNSIRCFVMSHNQHSVQLQYSEEATDVNQDVILATFVSHNFKGSQTTRSYLIVILMSSWSQGSVYIGFIELKQALQISCELLRQTDKTWWNCMQAYVTECMLTASLWIYTQALSKFRELNCKLIKLLASSWNSMQPLDNFGQP